MCEEAERDTVINDEDANEKAAMLKNNENNGVGRTCDVDLAANAPNSYDWCSASRLESAGKCRLAGRRRA